MLRLQNEYNKDNQLVSQIRELPDKTLEFNYTYDSNGRLTKYYPGTGSDIVLTYDELSRVGSVKARTHKGTYSYEGDADGGATTNRISQLAYTKTSSGTNFEALTYTYTYDERGNITEIADPISGTRHYEYDALGQMVEEKIGDTVYRYEYDNAGNLTSYCGNALQYTDEDWKDMATFYRTWAIYRDEMGNPTSYHNGTRWNFQWYGRQLTQAKKGGTELPIDYVYDENGLRITKSVASADGTTVHTYLYDNSGALIRETRDYPDGTQDIMEFLYDQSGRPYAFVLNNVTYYYVLNLQGDIVRLVNTAGTTVVSYVYNAWGKILSTQTTSLSYSATVAAKNPLRYRGYYFDTETGFYYLQSRYYDPALGRFLNADALTSTGQGILGNNMFAYCNNNPVMGYDPTGELDWGKLANGAGLLSIGLTACAVAATVVTGGACAPLIVAATLTFGAGGMTVANGAAEMIESATGYNFMRDGLQGGNTQFYERQKAFFASAAEAGTAALSMVGTSPYLCFVAGTVIVAAEGLRAIETIEAGDLVWAWDEETGDTALKEVVETYVNTTNELVHVFVDGEEIVTTPSHPFYSPVNGWTTAVHLRAGDILQLVNGEFAVVEKVQHEILETPVTVYNFQVEDYHTYYVSDAGVLVHNTCGNRGQLRKNMLANGPAPSPNSQAHHGLPWSEREYFDMAGLDVNDARFGIWVKGGGNGGHQTWSYRYGKLWRDYRVRHPIPDALDIIDYFYKLNGRG